jgi:hypothetical protein
VSGPIPCRDQMIVDRLTHHGIPSVYSSDLVFFDEDMIGTPFNPPKEIRSVVCTVQHHLHYLEQSIELFKTVARRFPEAEKYVSLHSVPSNVAKAIAARCEQFGFKTLKMFGEAENLQAYKDIDLHIGYRLHGHITFLRYRKPSILMVEDIRGFGLSRTPGTQFGTVDAFETKGSQVLAKQPRADAQEEVMALLEEQLNCGFDGYRAVFNFVDQTYHDFIVPYFDRVAKTTQLETF